jgi:hypothetical protein
MISPATGLITWHENGVACTSHATPKASSRERPEVPSADLHPLQMAAWVARHSIDPEMLLQAAGLLVADARRLCDYIPASRRASQRKEN